MICPYCKKEITDDTGFCPECGQNISNSIRQKQSDSYWKNVNREDTEREEDGGHEEQQTQQQGDVAPLLPRVPVDEAQAQESYERRDDRQEYGDLAASAPPLSLLVSSGPVADRLRLDWDLLVAFGAGHAVGRYKLAAVRAAPVGHVTHPSARTRCRRPRL